MGWAHVTPKDSAARGFSPFLVSFAEGKQPQTFSPSHIPHPTWRACITPLHCGEGQVVGDWGTGWQPDATSLQRHRRLEFERLGFGDLLFSFFTAYRRARDDGPRQTGSSSSRTRGPSIHPSHGTWKAVLSQSPPESTRYTSEPCRCHSVPAVISRAKRVYRSKPGTCTYGGGTHSTATPHPSDERDSRQTRCPSRVHCRKSLSLRLLDPCKGVLRQKGRWWP